MHWYPFRHVARHIASRKIMGEHQCPENMYDVPRVPVCITASCAQSSSPLMPAPASCQRPHPRRCPSGEMATVRHNVCAKRWLSQLTATAVAVTATPHNRVHGTRWRWRRHDAARLYRCESRSLCVSLFQRYVKGRRDDFRWSQMIPDDLSTRIARTPRLDRFDSVATVAIAIMVAFAAVMWRGSIPHARWLAGDGGDAPMDEWPS